MKVLKITGGDYELGLGKVVGLPIWDIVYGWAGQPLAVLYQGLLKSRKSIYFTMIWIVTIILFLYISWATKYRASSICGIEDSFALSIGFCGLKPDMP